MVEVSPALRQYVLDRDDYRCQVCGWGKELGGLHLHHVQFRSLGGDHESNNLVVLCWQCHTAVHQGRLVVSRLETEPGKWHTFWERATNDND